MPQTKPLKECVAGDDLEMGRVEYHIQNGMLVKLTAAVRSEVLNPVDLDTVIQSRQAELTRLQEAKAEYLKLIGG